MLITPFATAARMRVVRRAKPESATSDPTSDEITDSRPTVAGRFGNPNPAPGYGDHPTAGSTSSTPEAPTPSATPTSPRLSGAPQGTQRQPWRTDPTFELAPSTALRLRLCDHNNDFVCRGITRQGLQRLAVVHQRKAMSDDAV